MRSAWIMLGVFSATLMFGRYGTTTVFVEEPSTMPHVRTETRTDLYGNQISNAVADYRIDDRGNLYEQHAPDTALLKLGPPSS